MEATGGVAADCAVLTTSADQLLTLNIPGGSLAVEVQGASAFDASVPISVGTHLALSRPFFTGFHGGVVAKFDAVIARRLPATSSEASVEPFARLTLERSLTPTLTLGVETKLGSLSSFDLSRPTEVNAQALLRLGFRMATAGRGERRALLQFIHEDAQDPRAATTAARQTNRVETRSEWRDGPTSVSVGLAYGQTEATDASVSHDWRGDIRVKLYF